MPLGPDNTICKTEFVEAMRARLASDDPALAATVDKPGAQKNLGAMGQAVFRIATARAETLSDAGSDVHFWAWVKSVSDWMSAMARWQQDVKRAFDTYAPVTSAETNLRAAVLAARDPGNPPTAAPAALGGRIV